MGTIDDLSFSLKAAMIAARPGELRTTWKVAGGTDLAAVPGMSGRSGRGPLARTLGYLGRPAKATGEIWAVGMVRDEADVIRFTVEHLLAEGVDRVLIADNGSVDGTGDILREMGQDLPVTVVDDTVTAYYQGVKMTRLARCAVACGASWVVPADADELWYSPDRRTLAETLRSTDCDIAVAPMWNHIPADGDDQGEANPYLRMPQRTKDTIGVVKVAFRAHAWARLVPGNHNVRRAGRRAEILAIRQVPFRTPEQIARKHRNGSEAVSASDLPDDFCGHWRELAQLTDDEIVERVIGPDEVGETVHDPAPFRPLTPT